MKEKIGIGLLVLVIGATFALRGVSSLFDTTPISASQSQSNMILDIENLSSETPPSSEKPDFTFSPQPRRIYYLPNTIKNASASWGLSIKLIKFPLLVKNYQIALTFTPTPTPACSSVEHPDCYEPNNTFSETFPLTIPVNLLANGNPYSDPNDYYVVSLTAENTYRFSLMFAGINGNPSDASMQVYIFDSPSNVNLKCYSDESQGLVSAIFRYTPPTTGNYWVLAKTNSNAGNNTVKYEFGISPGTADKTCHSLP